MPMICSCTLTLRSKTSIACYCSFKTVSLTFVSGVHHASRANLKKLTSADCNLLVGGNIIEPSTTVRDLGVLLDSELSLKQHVNKVVSSCYYHIRRLRQVSHCVGQDVMKQLASSFILSRLDYCNSILAGLPKSTIATLQRVQNAVARMVLNLRPRESLSDGLRQLHWLPIESRIQFKLCLLMHLIHTGRCPPYLSETVQLVSDRASRTGLRSASTARYILPRLRTVFLSRSLAQRLGMRFRIDSIRSNLPTLLRSSSNHFYLITLSSQYIFYNCVFLVKAPLDIFLQLALYKSPT